MKHNCLAGTLSAVTFLLACLVVPSQLTAQNPKLNKYTFGEGLTFTGKKDYEVNLRGYAQPMVETKSYTEDENDNGQLNRFRMRRLRFRLTGDAAQQKIDYRFQVDLSGSAEVGDEPSSFLLDAWVRYSFTRRIKLTFGQSTTPTDNRELRMGSHTLQLPERSRLTSAFSSIREFGLFLDGTFKTGKGTYMRPSIAITNGDGLNANNRDYGGLKYGGRIDFLPFGLFTRFGQFRQADIVRERSPKLVIGGNYSYNQGMSSRRGRGSGAILYLNDENEISLPDYVKYGIDFLFKYRGFSMLGEFVASEAYVPDDISQRIRNDGTIATTFDVDGERDVENYIKGRMMLGKGYNIQMGYIFKNLWSVDARYTHLEADQHSFLNNGTFYNRPNYYTLGASKYLDRSYGIKVQASVTYVEADEGSNDIYSQPIDGNEWIVRLISTISF